MLRKLTHVIVDGGQDIAPRTGHFLVGTLLLLVENVGQVANRLEQLEQLRLHGEVLFFLTLT